MATWHIREPRVYIVETQLKLSKVHSPVESSWSLKRTSMALAAHSSALSPPSFRASHHSKPKLLNSRSNPPLIVSLPYYHHRRHKPLTISASVSVSNPEVRTGPDDLVASLLSKVYLYLHFLLLSVFLFPKFSFIILIKWRNRNPLFNIVAYWYLLHCKLMNLINPIGSMKFDAFMLPNSQTSHLEHLSTLPQHLVQTRFSFWWYY